MIRAQIYIQKYDWLVYCYIAVDCYYTYEILRMMQNIGADEVTLGRAHANLVSCSLDTGLCYSNAERRESVWVTSLTSSADEFLNSFVHEIRHLQQHIANTFDIDENSEEVCYLSGEIARALYPYCKELMCNGCRKHLKAEKKCRCSVE